MSGTPWQETAGRRANGEELVRAAALEAHTEAGRGFQIPLLCDLTGAMSLVASLQLALRHPANSGPTAAFVQTMVDGIIDRVESAGLLKTAALLRLGDDPAYDQKRESPPAEPEAAPRIQLAGVCRVCGCTDQAPCREGCAWANPDRDLCSWCAEMLAEVLTLAVNAGPAGRSPRKTLEQFTHVLVEVAAAEFPPGPAEASEPSRIILP